MPESIPNLSKLREQFPALQQRTKNGQTVIYFDGPGGTQVPQRVIAAMTDYLVRMAHQFYNILMISSRRGSGIGWRFLPWR